NALGCLHALLSSHKKGIRKEACWTISNITAGTDEQIQSVIAANIIPQLIQLLRNAEFDIRKESAWAISNATSGGTREQIKYLVHQGCIGPLCDLLKVQDTKIITVALEGLENILKVGDKEMKEKGLPRNEFARYIEEAEGLSKIEDLQHHENDDIYNKALNCPAGQGAMQDYGEDPCTCDADGIVQGDGGAWVFTGLPGCERGNNAYNTAGHYCFTSYECESMVGLTVFTPHATLGHNGAKMRTCLPVTDNDYIMHCGDCPPGYVSDSISEECASCEATTYNPSWGATECLQCPAELPWSEPGAGSEADCKPGCGAGQGLAQDPDDACACDADGVVDGVDTELPGCKKGNNPVASMSNTVACLVSTSCSTGAYNLASWMGLNGIAKWRHCDEEADAPTCRPCEPGFFSDGISEFCSMCEETTFAADEGAASCTSCPFDSPWSPAASSDPSDCGAVPCPSGSIWEGPEFGLDCTSCPAHLEATLPYATSLSECITLGGNFYGKSPDGIVSWSADDDQFHPINDVSFAFDTEFITETTFLASSYDAVSEMDLEGKVIGKFAGLDNPRGILHLPDPNQVAISVDPYDTMDDAVLFFDLSKYREIGTLQRSDASAEVGMFGGAFRPEAMSMGENDNEILVMCNKAVLRVCIPGTSCKGAARNAVLLETNDFNDEFNSIAVLPSRESYLVTFDEDYNSEMVECPFVASPTDTNPWTACTAFAKGLPEDLSWYPQDILVHAEKEVVYVSSSSGLYTGVYAFTLDGWYIATLTEGSVPSSLTLRPGPYAGLSSASPPASATAGAPVVVPITLRDDLNRLIPAEYPLVNETSRYSMSVLSTVRVDGGDGETVEYFDITFDGDVIFAPSAAPHEALTASFRATRPGNYTVSVTEGIAVKQHLIGSPFT
ncbi:hypothetical protein TeGR_g10133, partial [Tetraparma gracilis]